MAEAVEGMGLVRDKGGRRGHDHKLYINSVRLYVGKFMFSSSLSALESSTRGGCGCGKCKKVQEGG